MKIRIFACFLAVMAVFGVASAADPTATLFPTDDCLGSAKPYPAPEETVALPEGATAVFVNHVGRHGARFLSSPKVTYDVLTMLSAADSAGTLTPAGKEVLAIASGLMEICHNRWGALDSLGMAEQRGIASRMFRAYPRLFLDGRVNAISSYAPRCVMSMYEFTHQLTRLNNKVDITTLSGPVCNPLMRPFETDTEYVEWSASKEWQQPYDMFFETTAPATPARRLVSDKALSSAEARTLGWNVYKMLAGMPAMGMPVDLTRYFNKEELNAMWACENLGHYLRRTATTLSRIPADIAADLLLDLINTTDAAARGEALTPVQLRFGHAETLMPLLSLMHLRGCYYLTNYFDTVALHWQDFNIVPMAANLQIILFRDARGELMVRVDLNERPVPLLPDSDDLCTPWKVAREYLVRCLPLHLQP